MEIKKSPEANLERYKLVFFLIGLCLSLGICIVIFNVKSRGEIDTGVVRDQGPAVEEEIIPITEQRQEQKPLAAPPEAPKIVSKIQIVDRDVEFSEENPFDMEFDEAATVDLTEYMESGAGEEEEVEEEQIIYFAEEMPTFQGGGLDKFREYIKNNTKYPEVAAEAGIQGRVRVSFVVERDGSVSNVKVISGVDPLLDREAIRVVKSSPKWSPGRQRGKPARVGYNVPVVFVLN